MKVQKLSDNRFSSKSSTCFHAIFPSMECFAIGLIYNLYKGNQILSETHNQRLKIV